MVGELVRQGVPVVTPAGGLGCHIDAIALLDHVPQIEYPAGALGTALYIASGVRGMERGTLSSSVTGRQRDACQHGASAARHARRVFTLSQVNYAIDRIDWLYQNRDLVGGLVFTEEPEILRFFYGRLAPVGDWQEKSWPSSAPTSGTASDARADARPGAPAKTAAAPGRRRSGRRLELVERLAQRLDVLRERAQVAGAQRGLCRCVLVGWRV